MAPSVAQGAFPGGKCICEICNCGRHRCPHLMTRLYDTSEKPCLLSEYRDKYPLYPNVPPRESCKPPGDYKKQDAPMESISTMRTDYVPHAVCPIKLRPPEKYVRRDDNMDLLTTYKKDYNPYPISRVSPCVPQAQTYFSDAKMDTVPTYKSDYLLWKQPRRDLIKPDNTFKPSEVKFDHTSTTQDDYLYKGPIFTKSCKPISKAHISKIPLDSMTNYKLNYVPHPLTQRYVHAPEPYKPNEEPFDGLTTHQLSYKGLSGEPAKSVKPEYKREDLGKFAGSTEFQEKYLPWPLPAPFVKKRESYVPPKNKMDFLTTVQSHYVDPHGRPATSCKPVGHVLKSTDPFDHKSTMKHDYQAWKYSRVAPVVPQTETKLPTVPMDTLTTFQAHYVPHPLPCTKSFRPHLSAARSQVPFTGETTYGVSYTPKEVNVCPASYKDPPGYIFDRIDEAGHRRYRPSSVAQSRRSSTSKLTNYRDNFNGGQLSQAGLKEVAMKA